MRRSLRRAAAAVGAVLLLAAGYGVREVVGMLEGSGRPGAEGLPLIEVPAHPGGERETMVVFLSGDGGWVTLDRALADRLAARGYPVVGWNSLRYFWEPRTPEEAARDLERVVATYGALWGRRRVLLVGYSFGADALPFLVNRLRPELRARVSGVALLAMGRDAAFEFHLRDWFGAARGPTRPTAPEVERISLPVLCVHGTHDRETGNGCAPLQGKGPEVVALPGGHHFDARFARVARVLLSFAGRVAGAPTRG